jgi:hypothetical protein
MKHITLILLCGWLITACNKQTPALPVGNVVSVQISGFTVGDSLEMLNEGKVIATVINTFLVNTLLTVAPDQQGEIAIRKKGTTAIIATRHFAATPFKQSTSIFMDNGRIYDKSIKLMFRGYAMTDSLEFILDGQIVASGIENNFTPFTEVGAEDNVQRELQIRNKKTGAILSSRKITATPAEQMITFFYDGKALIDKINLTPPANPAYMNVSAKFETTLPDFFTGTPIDVVFYKYDIKKGVVSSEEAGIRLLVSGAFSEPIALPPLPADYRYTFRLAKTGTNTLPYDTSKDLLPIRNTGTNNVITFAPGSAQLWVIKDFKTKISGGPSKGTQLRASFTDLSQYFQ